MKTFPNCGKNHPTGGLTRPAELFLLLIFIVAIGSILFSSVAAVASRSSFAPTSKSIEGDWFNVATNPSFAGDIITDYISYRFLAGGVVVRKIQTERGIETKKGKYTWIPDKKEVDVKIDLGSAGIQIWTWKQDSQGTARIVHWKNLTNRYDRGSDDLFVKQGSDEWTRRNKRAINPQTSHPFIDPSTLKSGSSYRISKRTPLMPEFEPSDPINAIKQTRYLSAGTVIKIITSKQTTSSPWYYVKVGKNKGWINSVALFGQSLEVVY